ncbi:MAG: hypothetical protein Q9212_002621 [Teloschistes hypoglaucus]
MAGNVESEVNGSPANGEEKKTTPLRIWHCSHARTASNVLSKQFRDHPQLAQIAYTFMTAFIDGPEALAGEMTNNEAPIEGAEDATYQKGFNEMMKSIAKAEKDNKTVFIKEHLFFMLDPNLAATRYPPPPGESQISCPKVVDPTITNGTTTTTNGQTERTNPSILPDSFIRTLSPIIQIRHPAISIPSFYRARLDAGSLKIHHPTFLTNCTYAWSRAAFDWYCEHVFPDRKTQHQQTKGQAWPIVLDGDDLLNSNDRVIAAICALANFKQDGVTTAWQPVSAEARTKLPPSQQRFLSTLQASSGVIKSGVREGSVDVERETEKWREEFGEEVAERLKVAVEGTMEDYEYLMRWRI